MGSRVPALPRSELSEERQGAFDTLSKSLAGGISKHFVLQRESDGALVGPVPAYLVLPPMGIELMQCARVLGKVSVLSPEARETAILVVGSRYAAAYEVYAHAKVALAETALTKAQVQQLSAGEKPADLNDACSYAFDVASSLTSVPGPLPQPLWDRGIALMGKEGVLSLVHYCGFYAYTAFLLNAIDAPVPVDNVTAAL